MHDRYCLTVCIQGGHALHISLRALYVTRRACTPRMPAMHSRYACIQGTHVVADPVVSQ